MPSHPNSRTSFFLVGGRISAQRAEEEVVVAVVEEGTTKALVVPVLARRTRAVESFMVGLVDSIVLCLVQQSKGSTKAQATSYASESSKSKQKCNVEDGGA